MPGRLRGAKKCVHYKRRGDRSCEPEVARVSICKPWGTVKIDPLSLVMAAMYARSNADSPRSPDQFTLERGQVSSPIPSATILQEYSWDQLLDFIRETRSQATLGASPKKISTNHKFLDEDSNPRFAPSAWLALPTAGPVLSWPAGSTRPALST